MDPGYLDKTLWPYVGQIRCYFPNLNGQAAGATGTLITPRLILTAGHVVYDPSRGGYPTLARIELGGQQRTSVESAVFRTTQPWVDTDSKTMNPISAFDIGAILLDTPIPATQIAPASVAVTPGPNLSGLNLNVVGFPVEPALFGNLYGARSEPTLLSPALDVYRIFYPISTLDGMSGGPVYTREGVNGKVVLRGVHTSLYNGLGSGLRITQGIANLIESWVQEVS
jgi:V8-like Glu-specific endopeptidase